MPYFLFSGTNNFIICEKLDQISPWFALTYTQESLDLQQPNYWLGTTEQQANPDIHLYPYLDDFRNAIW